MTILYLSFKEIESQGEKKKREREEKNWKQEKREFSDDRENRMKKYEKNKKKKGGRDEKWTCEIGGNKKGTLE